ncbi:AAA family ATPase [Erwinia sp. S63]|uniref:AAA family ATPase n=1 Tax=Erwinia sp. S63 TaxID=2769341 RepID=UPI00190D8AA7|nr:AAA family ATPase [Erwinia sp. S63]MBK0098694.1 AAA family ATPase [Erwinia sp. S63]
MEDLKILVIERSAKILEDTRNLITLRIDTWNDYSFETLFYMDYRDSNGITHQLGTVKIGFIGQETSISTHKKIGKKKISALESNFFSLGTGPEYYEAIMLIPLQTREEILEKMNDVVVNKKLLREVIKEQVFKYSMLRSININTIKGQFARILSNQGALTDFDFTYNREGHEWFSDLELRFKVKPHVLPQTNIHTIIGRNGVGKTTLLNGMINDILKKKKNSNSYFYDNDGMNKIGKDYFSTIISISFSAFDPFIPLEDQNDSSKGTCFYYIGLKKPNSDRKGFTLRTDKEIRQLCAESLNICFSDEGSKKLWLKSIRNLESDNNFAELELSMLASMDKLECTNACIEKMESMSSGHAIVFLTITKLIEKTQQKTLILFDEPESHLHPPLLSALTRSLSDLLVQRNAIAILATHSPVVLQEVPKSCSWVISRFGREMAYSRPNIETFGENVGLLTKEVFQLEVERSGFHKLLKESVEEHESFDDIMDDYKNRIGFEGQALLRSMIYLKEFDNKKTFKKEGEGFNDD